MFRLGGNFPRRHPLFPSSSVPLPGRLSDLLSLSLRRDEEVVLISPLYVKGAIASGTKALFEGTPTASDTGGTVSWTARRTAATLTEEGSFDVLQSIRLPRGTGNVIQVAFHRKGDYFSSLCE